MKSNFLPPTWFLMALLLSILLNFLLPVSKFIPLPYRLLGIIFIVFGAVLNLWADAMFKKSQTTVKPHELPTALETSGPFRISRHPMYLGMAAILFGLAIGFGSLTPFIVPIAFIVLMEIKFIAIEEKNLESAFGEKYVEYKDRVRRWI